MVTTAMRLGCFVESIQLVVKNVAGKAELCYRVFPLRNKFVLLYNEIISGEDDGPCHHRSLLSTDPLDKLDPRNI